MRFAPITVEEYQAWAEGRNRACYIVTLLSRDIKAEQIARVSAITARHGLNIDNITRLSARPSLNQGRTALPVSSFRCGERRQTWNNFGRTSCILPVR